MTSPQEDLLNQIEDYCRQIIEVEYVCAGRTVAMAIVALIEQDRNR